MMNTCISIPSLMLGDVFSHRSPFARQHTPLCHPVPPLTAVRACDGQNHFVGTYHRINTESVCGVCGWDVARACSPGAVWMLIDSGSVSTDNTMSSESKVEVQPRFEVKKWNAVALWAWGTSVIACMHRA